MTTYIILGIAYFGILTLADKIGGYSKAGHRINFILALVFVGLFYLMNNF